MTTPRTDAEVLEATLEIIQEEGTWCKGSWFRDENNKEIRNPFYATQYCLEGAIQVATMRYHSDDNIEMLTQEGRIKNRLCKILSDPDQFGQVYGSIPGFNDDKKTSREDALLLVKYGLAQALEDEDASK
jgi:hypothetical protein